MGPVVPDDGYKNIGSFDEGYQNIGSVDEGYKNIQSAETNYANVEYQGRTVTPLNSSATPAVVSVNTYARTNESSPLNDYVRTSSPPPSNYLRPSSPSPPSNYVRPTSSSPPNNYVRASSPSYQRMENYNSPNFKASKAPSSESYYVSSKTNAVAKGRLAGEREKDNSMFLDIGNA